jgi:hypothetical protein
VVISGLEGAPRDDVDTDSEEILKILEQADVIKKGGTPAQNPRAKSTSLPGRASPLATEPNTATR